LENLLELLAATAPAQWMRFSRWGYAAVNTAHVLGIALLVGAIVPLDLKLLGAWRHVAIEPLARVLVPAAASGLTLAITTGCLLFLADPPDYAGRQIFLIKISLITAATLHALSLQLGAGIRASSVRLKFAGGFSLVAWLSVLLLGRLLAFTGD
jgi:hypothetical protein